MLPAPIIRPFPQENCSLKESFPVWESSVATSAFNATTTSKYAFLGDVLTLDRLREHTRDPTAQLFTPLLPDEGPMPLRKNEIALRAEYNQRVKQQAVDYKAWRTVFENSIALSHQLAISDGSFMGLTQFTTREIVGFLRTRHGTMGTTDAKALTQLLSCPYESSVPLDDHLDRFVLTAARLAEIGQPLSEFAKVQALTKSMEHCGLYTGGFQLYNVTPGTDTMALQTAANLSIALRKWDAQLQRAGPATFGYSTATAAATTTATAAATVLAPAIIQHIAAAVTSALQAAAAVTATKSTPAPAPRARKPQLFYCWTHGPSPTHNSVDCRKPAPNHNPAATASNKMGGRA